MIDARNRSGCLLSVFHNRRWDWDFLTVRDVLAQGRLGRPLLLESSVCRYAPPRGWRGSMASAGTILHDWGAHLVDQAPAVWTRTLPPADGMADEGTMGFGRFGRTWPDRPRVRRHALSRRIQPHLPAGAPAVVDHWNRRRVRQIRHRSAGRSSCAGNIDAATELPAQQGVLRTAAADGSVCDSPVATVRGHWDSYYGNIAEVLQGRAELAVTAEEAREVVRILDGRRAVRSRAPGD